MKTQIEIGSQVKHPHAEGRIGEVVEILEDFALVKFTHENEHGQQPTITYGEFGLGVLKEANKPAAESEPAA